jgi:hypothetical protein
VILTRADSVVGPGVLSRVPAQVPPGLPPAAKFSVHRTPVDVVWSYSLGRAIYLYLAIAVL